MSRVVAPPNSLSGSASPLVRVLNLRWRPLITSKCRYHPHGYFTQRLRSRLVPKDAESMGREDKPLLDFSSD